jgi:dihydrofolate reductase
LFLTLYSLDGFFEGPNKELDWHHVDEQFHEYAIDLLHHVDAILFGRLTYQMMAAYWTTLHAAANDPVITSLMNSKNKIVFSRTLEQVEWNNSLLINENIAEEITKRKHEDGKDMVIFGSGTIISFFSPLGLIDEYRIMVNPIILGSGNPLFKGIPERMKLKLIRTKTFNSGIVLLCYEHST